jgi:hypothetical protein
MRRSVASALVLAFSVIGAGAKWENVAQEWAPLNLSPEQKAWFKSVRSPHGVPCCDVSDGHRTTWRADPVNGHYWIPIEGEWREVPPEAVVNNAGNPVGEAVVWYIRQGPDAVYIRCFVPSGGV